MYHRGYPRPRPVKWDALGGPLRLSEHGQSQVEPPPAIIAALDAQLQTVDWALTQMAPGGVAALPFRATVATRSSPTATSCCGHTALEQQPLLAVLGVGEQLLHLLPAEDPLPALVLELDDLSLIPDRSRRIRCWRVWFAHRG